MKPSALLLLPLLAIFFSTFVLPSLCDDNGNVTNVNAMVTINGLTTVAKTDASFLCLTIDWWPEDKCNYEMCPWHKSSALNLDLENPILRNALKAFRGNPLRIRIGGSLQDQVIYNVGGNQTKSCQNFKKVDGELFGFTAGCLDMDRWKKLNQLFNESGAVVTFGLNALYGKRKPKKINETLWEGRWDSSNARDFINHTVSKGYNVDSWELGNELSGDGVAAKVRVMEYSKDLAALKAVINDLYTDKKPKVLAPGGFFDQEWFRKMLLYSGENVVDVVTHHLYDLGPGNSKDLFGNMQDPKILSKSAETFKKVKLTIEASGGWSSAWVGESGGAYNSGGLESGTFVDSFWYLDQLGLASSHDHKVYCRQSLIGGNYALLDTETFVPNPDYYSALLWHRLMGHRVLQVDNSGSPYLRAYAHCGRRRHTATLLLINLSNSTTFTVSVGLDMNLYPAGREGSGTFSKNIPGKRLTYRLTPKDGNLTSHVMLLNGKPLEISSTGEIPEMSPPSAKKASAPINIPPSSIYFVKFKKFTAPVCAEEEDINN